MVLKAHKICCNGHSHSNKIEVATGRAVGPAASLHGRWPPPRVTPTPAPCDYEASKAARAVLDHAPAFSIGLRVSLPQPGSQTPGGINQFKHF